jgi:hypothetical protein
VYVRARVHVVYVHEHKDMHQAHSHDFFARISMAKAAHCTAAEAASSVASRPDFAMAMEELESKLAQKMISRWQ